MLLLAAALFAGVVVAVLGFGIDSILTPLVAWQAGATKPAIVVTSVPHFAGNALRFWMLRRSLDRRVFQSFGLMSAAGGLAGALLHTIAPGLGLKLLFAALLVAAGIVGVCGLSERVRFRGTAAWVAGAASGLLGGLTGEQGAMRSAAMLGLGISKESFVATATATALAVDAARIPIYAAAEGRYFADAWPAAVVATAGVLAGILWGRRLFDRIPQTVFSRLVSAALLALGLGLAAASRIR